MERKAMDHIDIKILRYLTKDARMNASQISQRVNLSISAVIERMKKLESSGLIKGYTAYHYSSGTAQNGQNAVA